MRDHTNLRAFQLADQLVVAVYRATSSFPKAEQFGLTAQLRRASVSVASNIVEGCARRTEAEYLRFLDIAYGSVREVEYQLSLSHRLGYLQDQIYESVSQSCVETSKVLAGLIRSFRTRSKPPA